MQITFNIFRRNVYPCLTEKHFEHIFITNYDPVLEQIIDNRASKTKDTSLSLNNHMYYGVYWLCLSFYDQFTCIKTLVLARQAFQVQRYPCLNSLTCYHNDPKFSDRKD